MRPRRKKGIPVKKILVVDDDASSRRAVAQVLTEEGYEAATAADGAEAAGMLTSYRPDLVLTDLAMPRLDGRGLAERVHVELPGVPIVMFSGQAGVEATLAAARFGVTAFLAKPFSFDDLLREVTAIVGR
jgi:DNA-binding NtrC family response regulator